MYGVLLAAGLGWLTSHLAKFAIDHVTAQLRPGFPLLFMLSGGVPSSHAALASVLAITAETQLVRVLSRATAGDIEAVLALVFTLILIYDAASTRCAFFARLSTRRQPISALLSPHGRVAPSYGSPRSPTSGPGRRPRQARHQTTPRNACALWFAPSTSRRQRAARREPHNLQHLPRATLGRSPGGAPPLLYQPPPTPPSLSHSTPG